MDGKPTYSSSYPAHAQYAGQSADAAAAFDPNMPLKYGYGPPPVAGYPQPIFQSEPQIVVQNSTVANMEPGCECGVGWILFGVGWFIYLAWIVGAIMYCTRQKPSDKPGLLGCLIMTIIGAILIIIVVAANIAMASES